MDIRKGELELRQSLLTGAEGRIGDRLCSLARPGSEHKLEWPKSLQVTSSGVPWTWPGHWNMIALKFSSLAFPSDSVRFPAPIICLGSVF